MTHETKAEKDEIDAIERGEQTVIIRRNANFALQDLLSIREFDPKELKFKGRLLMARITHMKTGGEIQDGAVLSPNYVAMSIRLIGDAVQSDLGNFTPPK